MKKIILIVTSIILILLIAFLVYIPKSSIKNSTFSYLVNVLIEQEIETAELTNLSLSEAHREIFSLLNKGYQKEAESFTLSALKAYPDDPDLLMTAAVLHRSRWDTLRADHFFAKLINLHSNTYHANVAEISLEMDKRLNSEENLTRLVELSESNSDDIFILWLTAIQSRHQNKEYDFSYEKRKYMAEIGIQQYEKLIEKFNVGPVMLHHTYANLLTFQELYDKALEHRFLAISMEAKSWSLQGLGNTLYSADKYEWANAVWPQVIEKNEDHSVYYDNWGNTLKELKQYEAAEEKYRKAIELEPGNAKYHRHLGGVLFNKEEYQSAIDAYSKSIELNPDQGAPYYFIGYSLQELGERESSIEYYQNALQKGYDDAAKMLGWIYHFGRGSDVDFDKAITYYVMDINHTDSYFSHMRLGEIYSHSNYTNKNNRKALEHFDKAVSKQQTPYLLNRYAEFLLTCSDTNVADYKKSLELAKKSVKSEENIHNLKTLIMAYEKNGLAIEAYETKLRLKALKAHK